MSLDGLLLRLIIIFDLSVCPQKIPKNEASNININVSSSTNSSAFYDHVNLSEKINARWKISLLKLPKFTTLALWSHQFPCCSLYHFGTHRFNIHRAQKFIISSSSLGDSIAKLWPVKYEGWNVTHTDRLIKIFLFSPMSCLSRRLTKPREKNYIWCCSQTPKRHLYKLWRGLT